jgi:MFS family permease
MVERGSHSPYIIMLMVNAAVSVSGIFVPLLAREIGLSLSDVGIIGTAYGTAAFFSYILFGRLADITGRGREIILCGLVAGTVFFAAQVYMRDMASMVALRALVGTSVGMCTFPLFSYVSEASGYRERIGWLAGFGSLGWAIGYLAAGVVGRWREGFILSGIFFLIALVISADLGRSGRRRHGGRSVRDIFFSNFSLYLSYFLRHTGAYVVWSLFPVFLREELDCPVLWIGILHAINTGSQFLIMGMLGRRAGRWSGSEIFRLGTFLSAVSFFLYSAVTSYLQLIPIMLAIAFAWSCMYVGALVYLIEKNGETATATGMLGSTISLSMMVGPAVGGFVSQAAGLRMTGVVAGALSLAGLASSRLIR